MSKKDLLEQINLLEVARSSLVQRLGEPDLLPQEEAMLKNIAVLPGLPKKLFSRVQMISLIDKAIIASQLAYNEEIIKQNSFDNRSQK